MNLNCDYKIVFFSPICFKIFHVTYKLCFLNLLQVWTKKLSLKKNLVSKRLPAKVLNLKLRKFYVIRLSFHSGKFFMIYTFHICYLSG